MPQLQPPNQTTHPPSFSLSLLVLYPCTIFGPFRSLFSLCSRPTTFQVHEILIHSLSGISTSVILPLPVHPSTAVGSSSAYLCQISGGCCIIHKVSSSPVTASRSSFGLQISDSSLPEAEEQGEGPPETERHVLESLQLANSTGL